MEQQFLQVVLAVSNARMRKKKQQILFQTPSRILIEILMDRMHNIDKVVEVDYHLVEFDDVRYHIQSSLSDPQYMEISISIPSLPRETAFPTGFPLGAIEAVKGAYGYVMQIIDPPEEGFHLTLNIDLSKFPSNEETRILLITKIASLRAIVLGAPMRDILKNLTSKAIVPDGNQVISLMQRPKENLFIIPLPDKVVVVVPVHFKDSIDAVIATSFLQQFMEARRSSGLNKAPPCVWSATPPLEMKEAPFYTLGANAGFVSFVIFPHHVEGSKVDRIVWTLLSFHAYINHHIKCSKCFMHTVMRRGVEKLIQALNQTKLHVGEEKKTTQGLGCVRKLWTRSNPQSLKKVGGYHMRQVTKVSVPIQLQRTKQYRRQRIPWRCLKAPKIYSLKKYAR